MTSTGPATIRAPSVALGLAPAGGVVLGPGLSSIMTAAAGVFVAQSAVFAPLLGAQNTAIGVASALPNPGSNLAAINALNLTVTALATSISATLGGAMTTMATSAASAPVSSATVTATP